MMIEKNIHTRQRGHSGTPIAHLSPARCEHLKPYGKYTFAIDDARKGLRLRPLRIPTRTA